MKSLPDMYKDVLLVATNTTTPQPNLIDGWEHHPTHEYPGPVTLQMGWLQYVWNTIGRPQSTIEAMDYLFGSEFFSRKQSLVPRPSAITAFLPLVSWLSTHSRDGWNTEWPSSKRQLKWKIQVPILTVDQPLYALAKKIQWLWPDEYGEAHYVVLIGDLLFGIAFLKFIGGDWLECSGLITALTNANIVTAGSADHMQKVSHIFRGQWIHKVMVCALYILLCRAYASYRECIWWKHAISIWWVDQTIRTWVPIIWLHEQDNKSSIILLKSL